MWQQFTSASEAGDLWVDPSIAIDAREAAGEWVAVLRQMHRDSRSIQRADGFSDLPSAVQLAAKFDKMVTDPETGLSARLSQFIQAGEELSELFLHSIQKFSETDAAAAAYLERNNLPKELPTPPAG